MVCAASTSPSAPAPSPASSTAKLSATGTIAVPIAESVVPARYNLKLRLEVFPPSYPVRRKKRGLGVDDGTRKPVGQPRATEGRAATSPAMYPPTRRSKPTQKNAYQEGAKDGPFA